jgi:hypothetical protein
MPLFMCTKCGSVENTALSRYWQTEMEAYERGRKHDPLCSACDPEIAAWHGQFERKSAAGYFQTGRGHLYTEAETTGRAKHMGPFKPVVLDLPPEFIRQTTEPKTPEERKAWIETTAAEARELGLTFARAAFNEEHNITLLEYWRYRPDEQGEPRFKLLEGAES